MDRYRNSSWKIELQNDDFAALLSNAEHSGYQHITEKLVHLYSDEWFFNHIYLWGKHYYCGKRIILAAIELFFEISLWNESFSMSQSSYYVRYKYTNGCPKDEVLNFFVQSAHMFESCDVLRARRKVRYKIERKKKKCKKVDEQYAIAQ